MPYQLDKACALPDRLATGKVAIIGRTGSGKTNTAVVCAEQMIDAGLPVVILDPQGDWWGLRAKYPIAILGGDHQDVPLEPTGGALAADFCVRERVSVLLDLVGMGEGEMVRFATDFARRLWTTNREALTVFLDEADLFAPQRTLGGDKPKCLSAWQNVASRGRSRGLGLWLLSQRTAKVSKDLTTQCDPLIVHRLTAPQDLAAVDAYLEYHGLTRAERQTMLQQVAALEVGEAFVISPGELGIKPQRVRVARRRSFDSSATPQPGKTVQQPKTLAQLDLAALKTAMHATIEHARAHDPKLLRQRIAELEQQLRAAPPSTATPKSAASSAAALAKSAADRDRQWEQRLAASRRALVAECKKLSQTFAQHLQQFAQTFAQHLQQSATRVDAPAPQTPPALDAPEGPRRKLAPTPKLSQTQQYFHQVTRAEFRILRALYWLEREERTPAKVAFYSGYTVNGHFNNTLGSLRSRQLVQGWTLTDAGRAVIPDDVEPKPTGPELREWLRPKLGTAENKLLDALVRAAGERLSAETLAAQAGFTVNGHFNNCLGRLRALQIAEGYAKDGGVRAAELFFQ